MHYPGKHVERRNGRSRYSFCEDQARVEGAERFRCADQIFGLLLRRTARALSSIDTVASPPFADAGIAPPNGLSPRAGGVLPDTRKRPYRLRPNGATIDASLGSREDSRLSRTTRQNKAKGDQHA